MEELTPLFAILFIVGMFITLGGCHTNDPPPSLWEKIPNCDNNAPSHYEYRQGLDDEISEIVSVMQAKNWSNITVDEKREWTEIEAFCPIGI